MSKETAVDWFIKKDSQVTIDFLEGKITQLQLAAKKATLIQQAKQMEKEQTIEFSKRCLDKALDLDARTAHSKVEDYYSETYGECI